VTFFLDTLGTCVAVGLTHDVAKIIVSAPTLTSEIHFDLRDFFIRKVDLRGFAFFLVDAPNLHKGFRVITVNQNLLVI
jgi:hypothetical protein